MRVRVCIALTLIFFCGSAWAKMRVLEVPPDHYLGISPPCPSIAEARDKAVRDVAAQVLRSIGAEYSVEFWSRVIGTADSVNRRIEERFHYRADGFLTELEKNTVSQSLRDTRDGIVYEMLVHFPRHLVKKMRRLSRGAKVIARWVGEDVIELSEVNGVAVTFTEAEVVVREENRHAAFLNYYVMKVSPGSSSKVARALPEPVTLKKSSKRFRFVVHTKQKGLRDLVLGTKRSVRVTLSGQDEVGRAVKALVQK
jgi:hypothetical protein